jgi:hypothetical protein
MNKKFTIVSLSFCAAMLLACDPAYSKRFLIKEGEEKPFAETRMELLGFEREVIERKFEELCRENSMERHPKDRRIEFQCSKKTEKSRLHFYLQTDSEKDGAYLVLLDFGAFSQSNLSAKLEKELVDFSAVEKARGN